MGREPRRPPPPSTSDQAPPPPPGEYQLMLAFVAVGGGGVLANWYTDDRRRAHRAALGWSRVAGPSYVVNVYRHPGGWLATYEQGQVTRKVGSETTETLATPSREGPVKPLHAIPLEPPVD